MTESQKRANYKYVKKSRKTISLSFFPPDYELYDFLRKKENYSGYLKNILRRESGLQKGHKNMTRQEAAKTLNFIIHSGIIDANLGEDLKTIAESLCYPDKELKDCYSEDALCEGCDHNMKRD